MKKSTKYILISAFLLTGCVKYGVKEYEDKFDGYKVVEQDFNGVVTNAILGYGDSFDIRIMTLKDGSKSYQVQITRFTGAWNFVKSSEPLKVMTDKDRFDFNYVSSVERKVIDAKHVKETTRFKADKESLYKISQSNSFSAKLAAEKGFEVLEFDQEVTKRCREFLAQYDK